MGPTCEVHLETAPDADALNAVDAFLAKVADRVERTRKGRTWDVWVSGRPVHVAATISPARIELSAGCNSAADYDTLRRLCRGLAEALGGLASEPAK